MKKLSAVLLIWLAGVGAALAQSAGLTQSFTMPPPAGVTVGGLLVVGACGSRVYTAGQTSYATMDTTGKLCTQTTGVGTIGQVTIPDGADIAGGYTTDTPCALPATAAPCSLNALTKAVANQVLRQATTTMAVVAPTAGTFSVLLDPNTSRKACLIQNTGTTLGYIYPRPTGGTTTNAFQITAGGSFSCNNGIVTLTDGITGTCASSTCSFVISTQ